MTVRIRFGTSKSKTRLGAVFTSLAFIAVLLPTVLATSASAAPGPDHVNLTLDGCRNTGSITLPNGAGDFVCPDGVYTSGNLGKGWNELDLVPYRLTSDAGT